MDIDKVKELVQLMVDNDLSSLSLRNGSEEVTLRRPNANGAGHVVAAEVPLQQPGASGPVEVASGNAATAPDNGGHPVEEDLQAIPSPMVGTIYAAANPEAPPFVQVGSKVMPETVVCIIEAMKVFNEIRAEVTGTIERILVSNQQAVEYGQVLFLVRPD